MTLPQGWVETTVGEAAIINPKHDPATDRNKLVSFVPMPSVDEHLGAIVENAERTLADIWTGYTHFADGDVIFAKITPCMENGKAAIARSLTSGLACGSTEFYVMRPADGVSADYLWRFVRQRSFRTDAERRMTGAVGQRRVPREYLENHRFPLPPAPEQRRIVGKLDALTARLARARAELDRVPVFAQRLRNSILDLTFESVGSSLISLGEIGMSIEAGKNLKCDERPPNPDENGVVKVSAVSSEHFLALESKTLPKNYTPPERDRIVTGDLLLARASGSLSLVGRVALVEQTPNNLFLSDKVLRLRVPKNLTSWIYWFLRSPAGRSQIEAAASGISMHNITQGSLSGIRLSIPAEDVRAIKLGKIAQTFARADRLEAEAARARALIDRLESAILAKAFRGELVPQDPNDEPASVLLDRIRAERAAAPKAKRGRRAKADA
ncbi:type I restriction enzyme S subunit [Sphingomonas sp. BE123]|uniref:restriction endonuclease subunit S n=1 Tax=Sphingomonas sp. BE123 TaxID=2817842 RepID=UPI0028575BD1|nr:restriction endonuclease subunit S [Sphingomonas sp. BE123]MDR6851752.1 type I restriction enzyme S subunit [Sphingomonas sp. BE123]